MLKTVAAGAAVLMLATGAVVYAQQPPAGRDFGARPFAPEDRAAFQEAHVAALHAGLRLTADQEKAWPAFEQAWRELAALRGNRPAGGRRAEESLDPVQRAQRRAEALTTRGAALKRYADALAPLYQSLDDGQKRRFGFLSRIGEEHRFHRFAFLRGGDRERGEFGRREGEFRSPSDEFRGPRGEFRGPRGEFGRGFPPPPLHDE
jgi:LTXXQ motif family protein